MTLHTYELAAVMAAARYVVTAAPGDVPDAARDQLGEVLRDYDAKLRRLAAPTGRAQPGRSRPLA
ncbi:hypothetical protein [Geodermatophilus telluris]|uniref:hypothetical protein n=1 Tax=Geodermatophilus telluris TaxID=1190417 RepID=UPI0011145D75|nr:hypothetical protein [Geodermatophilus telluris]